MKVKDVTALHLQLSRKLNPEADSSLLGRYREGKDVTIQYSGRSYSAYDPTFNWQWNDHVTWIKVVTEDRFVLRDLISVIEPLCRERGYSVSLNASWRWVDERIPFGPDVIKVHHPKVAYEFFVTFSPEPKYDFSVADRVCLAEDPSCTVCLFCYLESVQRSYGRPKRSLSMSYRRTASGFVCMAVDAQAVVDIRAAYRQCTVRCWSKGRSPNDAVVHIDYVGCSPETAEAEAMELVTDPEDRRRLVEREYGYFLLQAEETA